MFTVPVLLAIAALICVIVHAIGRLPLWVAVLLLCLIPLVGGLR